MLICGSNSGYNLQHPRGWLKLRLQHPRLWLDCPGSVSEICLHLPGVVAGAYRRLWETAQHLVGTRHSIMQRWIGSSASKARPEEDVPEMAAEPHAENWCHGYSLGASRFSRHRLLYLTRNIITLCIFTSFICYIRLMHNCADVFKFIWYVLHTIRYCIAFALWN